MSRGTPTRSAHSENLATVDSKAYVCGEVAFSFLPYLAVEISKDTYMKSMVTHGSQANQLSLSSYQALKHEWIITVEMDNSS